MYKERYKLKSMCAYNITYIAKVVISLGVQFAGEMRI